MNLKKVTPAALRVLSKYKLDVLDPREYAANLLKVCQNDDAIKEVYSAISEDTLDKKQIGEMDLSVFHQGIRDFLARLLAPTSN
jgi:hypothetical protein